MAAGTTDLSSKSGLEDAAGVAVLDTRILIKDGLSFQEGSKRATREFKAAP